MQIEISGKILNTIKELAVKENLTMVLLFGSQAIRTAKAESDIDFAISAGRVLSDKELLNLNYLFSTVSSIDTVDVVDVMKAPPLLMKQIADSARLLYQKTPYEFPNFCIYALRRYIETKPLFDLRRQRLQVKL